MGICENEKNEIFNYGGTYYGCEDVMSWIEDRDWFGKKLLGRLQGLKGFLAFKESYDYNIHLSSFPIYSPHISFSSSKEFF